jgi:hypothetical protein
MKILVPLLLFLIVNILAQTPLPTPEWIMQSRRGVHIQPRTFEGFNFNVKSEIVKFTIKCERMCDIILLTAENLPKLRSGIQFEYHWFYENALDGTFTFYDQKYIKQNLFIVVRNQDTQQEFRANFELGNYMIPEPDNTWIILTSVMVPSTFLIVFGVCVCCGGLGLFFWLITRRLNKKSESHVSIIDDDGDVTYDRVIGDE